MNKIKIDLVIPIYNEGGKIIKLFSEFKSNIKTNFRVLLCYDKDDDDIFKYKKEFNNFNFEIKLLKNPNSGPCSAIIEGLNYGGSECVIVYPADDFLNFNIIDEMYKALVENNDVVVASRFMKGGSMKGCPLIKSILVRLASSTLYMFSSIPVKDASNGFRLFSRRLLDTVYIESKVGFAYSLELLSKCNRLKFNVKEIPAQWEERSEGSSRFKILKWLPEYLRWYFYGLGTSWLNKKPEDHKNFLKAYELFANHIDDIPSIQKIDSKTLVMTGSDDLGSTPTMSKELAKDLSNSTYIEIKNGKHLCSIECADDVNMNIKNFINN